MTRYLRLALLFGALMAILAFAAACGGDDDDEPTGGDAEDATATTASGDEDEDDATAEATEEDEEDSADALERLREAAAAAANRDSFYASYEMRFIDAEGVESTGTMTLAAKKPLELFRMVLVEEEGESDIAIIQDGETSTICIKDLEDEGSCLLTPGDAEDSPFGSLTSIFTSTDELLDEITAEDDVEVTPAGSKRVAGLDADCYDVKDSTGEGTVCIAEDESLVVEMVGTFEGEETEFRLTEYSDDPDDDVFEPPYEVTSLAG
ncbi:MAG: hypothetical protein ACSLFM_14520 [Tepidiformaceae bacterium]